MQPVAANLNAVARSNDAEGKLLLVLQIRLGHICKMTRRSAWNYFPFWHREVYCSGCGQQETLSGGGATAEGQGVIMVRTVHAPLHP